MNALFFLFVGICANSIAAIKSNDSDCDNHPLDPRIPSIHAMLVRDRYIANEISSDSKIPIGEKTMKLPYPYLKRMLVQFNAINGSMKSRILLVDSRAVKSLFFAEVARRFSVSFQKNDTLKRRATSAKNSDLTALVDRGKHVVVVNIENENLSFNHNSKEYKPDEVLTQPIRELFLKIDFYMDTIEVSQIIFQTDGKAIHGKVCYENVPDWSMIMPALLIEIECETTIVKKILTESMSKELPKG